MNQWMATPCTHIVSDASDPLVLVSHPLACPFSLTNTVTVTVLTLCTHIVSDPSDALVSHPSPFPPLRLTPPWISESLNGNTLHTHRVRPFRCIGKSPLAVSSFLFHWLLPAWEWDSSQLSKKIKSSCGLWWKSPKAWELGHWTS